MLLKKRIPMKYVLGKIKVEIVLVLAYTILFEIFHHYFINLPVDIPIAIPTMIGTIISLLLAFKSNQAYDRWWEARIVWGAVVNDSRTLIRQMLTFYKDPDFSVEASEFKENFAKRQIAWCYSLGQSLRNKDAIKPLSGLVSEEEIRFIKNHQNVPNAILMFCTHVILEMLKMISELTCTNRSKSIIHYQGCVMKWVNAKELRILFFQRHTACISD